MSFRSMTWFALVMGVLMVAGCSTEGPDGETGSLDVSLQLEGDIEITEVEWVITAEGMEPMSGVIDTSAIGSTASVEVFGLPPGDGYTITMAATAEDGETECGGSADFSVEPGVATTVMVMLNCKPPEDLGGVRVNGKLNVCTDLVKVVVAPLQTSVGNDIDLSALGVDYEGDEFEYLWEATGGTVNDPSAADTFYTCEQLGKQEVRVTVSDDGFEECNCDWTVEVTCVDGGLECMDDEDCGENESCVDGACVPDLECTEDADCDDGEICVDNECVPDLECTEDADCEDGEICVDNECVPDLECTEDADCDAGEICVDNECVPDLECTEDADCDDGEICVDNECVPDVECLEDADCDDANVCTVNTCVDGLCDASAVICEDDNECTVGACSPELGCEFANVEDGTECDEGNGACMAGECKTNELLGNEFVVVFGQNYVCDLGPEICGPQPNPIPELTLFLSGPKATSGVVSILSSGFTAPFEVTPGIVTTVTLPERSELQSSDVIESQVAVRIAAEEQITAYGLNRIIQTTDAFAAIPTDALGQRYRVMAWPASINGLSQLAIAAIAPDGDMDTNTNVTITPSDDAGGRAAGVPYTIELAPFDAYQLQSEGDLTGTLIEADAPIAVFGGNRCGNIPGPNTGFCDHLVEQIPPTSSWGSEALTVPLATRSFGDTFVVLADRDGTTVVVEGEAADSFVLNAGESEQLLLETSHRVTADGPILVSQYSNGSEWDGETADPFMMLIPTSTQFVEGYTFATPGMGFSDNYANIVALTSDAAAGDVLLDGASIPPGSFTELAGTSYSAAQVPIAVGTHTIEAPNPLGLYVYGYAEYDSYGYPGGFSVAIAP